MAVKFTNTTSSTFYSSMSSLKPTVAMTAASFLSLRIVPHPSASRLATRHRELIRGNAIFQSSLMAPSSLRGAMTTSFVSMLE